MFPRTTLRRAVATAATAGLAAALTLAVGPAPSANAATLTTAWQNGAFSQNAAGVVGRSDIVLGRPNTADTQYLPLGNGTLGVAEWAAGGFTAQLNRSDTMPDRKSPGQVQIPGLAAMTSAPDFKAVLDLYNGVLDESGGGMTAKVWVASNKDELVVDVTGADPAGTQTATVHLWSGRSPSAAVSGSVATLAETWVDNSGSGASGQTFGSLAAITAGGRNVSASVVDSTSVQVSFKPDSNGSFRVVVGAPAWTGGNAATTAAALLGSDATAAESSLLAAQTAHWNGFWGGTGLMEISSADGSGEYLENLRTLYLYDEAASTAPTAGSYGGSQAGVADLFNFDQDHQDWFPAGYWLWNLRAEIAANMSSGNFAENLPVFSMYLDDLPAIESWTSAQMGGKPGACVPETMRFNGNGWYNGGTGNASCSLASSPSYNAENVTSGAEIALWIWQQYQDTGSLSFLQTYYPVMEQAATFLLAYQSVGSDGFLHATANAHETQWAVTDPTTDLAADAALFPATVSAATLLGKDSALVARLRTAEQQIEPYARTDQATRTQLLTPAADASGADVIADSFQPSAPLRNGENIGLEPVWPYGLIGDSSSATLTALADRTYTSRPNVSGNDWSLDAVDAARLDLGSQVSADLVSTAEHDQGFISGAADLSGAVAGDEPYLEHSATVATALDEALATDYDGTLRFAPAWPPGWNGSGTVYIQNGSKVEVQVQNGTLTTAALVAGTTGAMTVRNPWAGRSGHSAEVVNGSTGAVVLAGTTATTFSLPVTAGSSYLVEDTASPTTSYPFAQVTGSAATADKHLGPVQIGLDPATRAPSLAATFNDVGISADDNTAPGDFDGGNASYSQTALSAAGAGPGASVTASGKHFTMPGAAAGAADNTVADGQTISIGGSGGSLGFLVSGSYGPASGTGTVTYTDGTTQSYSLSAPDWFSTTAPTGGAVAVTSAYQNRQGNTVYQHTADLFSLTVGLDPTKTLASVTLPALGTLAAGSPALHVWAISLN
ncbi:glycosyl hydrolase family 95 catalytic domain-containing protein [Streptacidiphilus cavernicola]|uniref:Glycosyl hydrolase family 95 catalytic domain-containing protein n=1 Tax=Streptacidiphilus cavernicola TaxID=3342716 RepID=A0ABV6VW27_9ACTN